MNTVLLNQKLTPLKSQILKETTVMKKHLILFATILMLIYCSLFVYANEYDAFEIPYNSSYKYGVFNKSGKTITSNTYLYVGNYHDGLAKAKDNLGWLYIDTSGKVAFRASLCSEVGDFHEGLAKAKDSIGWKYFNTKGNVVFSATLCSEVGDFHDGLARAKDSIGWKFFDKTGKVVFNASLCSEVGDFHDGLVRAKDSVGWKFFDKTGKVAFNASLCSEVGDFHDGLVRAKDSIGWKFFDKTGKVVFNASLCSEVGDFHDGLVRAKDSIGWKFLDKTGKNVLTVSGAKAVSDCCNGYIIFSNSGSGDIGIINNSSNNSSNSSEEYLKHVDPPSLPPRYDASKFVVTNSTIILNGEKQSFSVPTISYLDRTLVPMRELFEKLGTEVIWNNENKSITVKTPTKDIFMIINNQFVISRGHTLVIDVPPMLYNGKTVVPLRFVCEQLHLDVEWNGNNNTITLTSKGDVTLGEITEFGLTYYGEIINGKYFDGVCDLYHGTGENRIKDYRGWVYSDGYREATIVYDADGNIESYLPVDNTGMYYGPLTTNDTNNSQTYLGNITNGVPDGYGYVEFDSGDYYYGFIKNGKKSGQGVYVWSHNSQYSFFYSGEWENDQANGFGTHVWKDGTFHIGNFKNGIPNGYGMRYYPNGTVNYDYWT